MNSKTPTRRKISGGKDWKFLMTRNRDSKFNTETIKMKPALSLLSIGIAIIQLLDIFIHAVTDQLEIIRVSSNLIILVWLAGVTLGWFNAKFLPVAIGSLGLYSILNVIFLVREGLTNPEQGGGLRTTLFLLMFLTVTFSSLFTLKHKKRLSRS